MRFSVHNFVIKLSKCSEYSSHLHVPLPGVEQDFDPQTFESLKWMLANTGARDWGFHFEDIGQPEKVGNRYILASRSGPWFRVLGVILALPLCEFPLLSIQPLYIYCVCAYVLTPAADVF